MGAKRSSKSTDTYSEKRSFDRRDWNEASVGAETTTTRPRRSVDIVYGDLTLHNNSLESKVDYIAACLYADVVHVMTV